MNIRSPGYVLSMSDPSALERVDASLSHHALAVDQAYRAAVASDWAPEFRDPLWEAGLEAVLAYSRRAPEATEARRFYHLVVDLAPHVPQETLASWPVEPRRALRLAATHTLVYPGRPYHRPRAQALLKRLDSLDNPVLAAREALLTAIARQRQAIKVGMFADPGLRRSPASLQAFLDQLSLISACMRELQDYPEEQAPLVLEAIATMQWLVEAGRVLDGDQEDMVFMGLQLLRSLDRPVHFMDDVLQALAVIRAHTTPGLHHATAELKQVLFDLELGRLTEADGEAFRRHLEAFTHVAKHLQEIPAASLPALIFRLRNRLADPSNEVVEPLLDESLATIERLDALKNRLQAELQELEEAGEDSAAVEIRLQEVDALQAGVLGLRLRGLTTAQAPGVVQLLRQVEALAEAPLMDAESFDQEAERLAHQLRQPQLISNRVWQAAQAAILQAQQQKRVLDETLRGLPLDRRLTPDQREASRNRVMSQLDGLEKTRMLLQSLPFDRLAPEREREALTALSECILGMRAFFGGGEANKLRSALEALTRICSRSM